MWESVVDRMLRRLVVLGELTVEWPDGSVTRYGRPEQFAARARIADRAMARALCLSPVLALGEGYMDGRIEVADNELFDLVALLVRNRERGGAMPKWVSAVQAWRNMAKTFALRNTPGSARRNVAHHYDISDDLYRLFLDRDMQYSCAYFERPDMTLDEAQEAKKHHIARKLRIEPGMRVLDIGCGWGGMALTLARDYGAHVTGVTLSSNQHRTAQARAAEQGVSERTDFRLQDYRDVTERFDRIVSVGMLEHVGPPQFPTYFDKVGELLDEDGIALIHTIGLTGPPSPTSPWILKYIFPGGYVPALSDLAGPLENAGLWTADIEVLRGHYGPTLHHWRERFESNLPRVLEMYDERFVRMWRFYLAACETAFEEQHQAVYQLQLSKKQYAVPRTRGYLYADAAARGRSWAQAAQ
ncbi:Cyclopropane-fatty-acyl-phospholipid synthase [Roseivivax jejudonensis]|uniref:Cyclopropane-fatty-acyl-phospholipid synthase n=1 Tax=Roseivivax jejudonensis TaxID=1529041 RepID=A0A1X6YJD3_9RHOB|nr:cyclopropane-fatty-acyl-phospholipid synthase family protein [Roseivivax jejudonensis]SLN22969.1 Cyclopropane-fatty-acyl-phospholipid synthase [Roseivivax jejudonensis]